ncbi:MAG: hypothetical protein V3T72_03525 [Thermoanaerobaculia bacterium]
MTSAAARWLMVAGCAATLALVVAVPSIQPSRGSADGPFTRFAGSLAEVLAADGWLAANRSLLASMDELERGLERDSVLMRSALPTAQQLLSAWGGVGNEKVYLGDDGWLFFRPGVDYSTGPPFLDPAVLERRARSGESWQNPPQPDPLAAVLDFHRQLESRGIRLLVLPAPTKAMIYPEKLRSSTSADASFHNPAFAAFRAQLERHGVEVFDPAAALLEAKNSGDEDVFLRTDSHWSPAGLEAVAAALAERLRDLGFGSPGLPGARRAAVVHRGDGDLERMLELPEDSSWPPPEKVRLRRVVGVADDRPPAILLLGDSFSNVFSQDHLGWGKDAGLAEQLAFELGEPVERLAVDAGGAWSSRQKLAGDPGRLAGKRLVIYQFAVRELAIGDWRLIQLPAPLPPVPSPP